MEHKLKDKVALITGGTRGIGRAIAEELASAGVHLLLNYVARKPQEEMTEKLRKCSVKVVTCAGDVSNEKDVSEMFALVDREFGRIDILVNNAGILKVGYLHEMDDHDWDVIVGVNMKGVFNCSKAAAARMIPRHSGKIINVSSQIAWLPVAGAGAYCATKMAVITLTKTMAAELGPYGISVLSIAPGMIETDLNDEIRRKGGRENLRPIAAGRIGLPKDVADLVVFLCSPSGDYLTGSIVEISGGTMAVQNPWDAYAKAGVQV